MPNLFVQRTAGQTVARQLAQTQPVTAAASMYTPGVGAVAIVKRIIVCNTSATAAAFDLFHDDDGTTYDATTQLYKDYTVTAAKSLVLTDELYMDSSANLAALCGATATLPLTFTIYGEEVKTNAR